MFRRSINNRYLTVLPRQFTDVTLKREALLLYTFDLESPQLGTDPV